MEAEGAAGFIYSIPVGAQAAAAPAEQLSDRVGDHSFREVLPAAAAR